jgi:hypothetical protein
LGIPRKCEEILKINGMFEYGVYACMKFLICTSTKTTQIESSQLKVFHAELLTNDV